MKNEVRELTCQCGATVKVKNYGKLAKKNKKHVSFAAEYNDKAYQCSKCRGIIIAKKASKPKIKEERVYASPNRG